MLIIWYKIFKQTLKDYLFLHYLALGTFSAKGVHIIKYLLTQIHCCILICVMLCEIFRAPQTMCFILYCITLHYIHVMICSKKKKKKGSMEII
jgi:hypothetical protein